MASKNNIANARKLAKQITTSAKANNAKVAAKALTAPSKPPMGAQATAAKATVAATQNTGLGAAMANAFYQQKVVANKKVAAPNAGSFYGKLQALAAKPITLQALAVKAMAANKFTSSKNHGMVARVRTRHALTRYGYLVVAK